MNIIKTILDALTSSDEVSAIGMVVKDTANEAKNARRLTDQKIDSIYSKLDHNHYCCVCECQDDKRDYSN
jgi:hypothetical protein